MSESSVEKQIAQVRSRISMMANRVVMEYEDHTEKLDVKKEWMKIAPAVESIECALNGDDCTVLNVRFKPGGKIERHVHEHNDEEIFVIAGELTVRTGSRKNNNAITILPEGSKIKIPKGVWHEVESNNARITVVFRPPFLVVINEENE